MDIRIVPIMVKEDGTVAVHMASTYDPSTSGFTSFSNSGLPDRKAVLGQLPKDILAGNDSGVVVKTIPSHDPEKAFVVVAGREGAFSPPRLGEAGRWVSQGDFKFGPLPQNVTDTRGLQDVYTETLRKDDFAAMLAGVYTAKALKADEEIPEKLPALCARFAESPQAAAIFMSPKMDHNLVLGDFLSIPSATKFSVSRRTFGVVGAKLLAFVGQKLTQAGKPDGLVARAGAKTANSAARISQGYKHKPA